MLVVITIIMVLVGIAYTAFQRYIQAAQIENTRQTLAKVEMAISQYRTSYGHFPYYDGDWADGEWSHVKRNNKQLYAVLESEGLLEGLIDEKTHTVEDAGERMVVDFWGFPLIYLYATPAGVRPDEMPAAPTGSGRMFELWSAGPDGAFQMLGRTKRAGGGVEVELSVEDDDNITATKMF